jgi:opacity protein-like surface antigen
MTLGRKEKNMDWRRMLFLVFLFVCAVPSARAQRTYEVTPFVGTRFGGKIDVATSTVDHINIKSGIEYGAIGDVSIWPNFDFEFIWNRQPTTLSAHSSVDGSITPLTNANLDMYQFGMSYAFRSPEAKLKPFFATGLGFTHFGQDRQVLAFTDRFSYNVGGGVKYFFDRHVGLRLETRYSPSHTTSRNAIVCNPFFGFCSQATVANKAQQGQANLGLIFRF